MFRKNKQYDYFYFKGEKYAVGYLDGQQILGKTSGAVPPVVPKYRYIRDYIAGSSANQYSAWTEIKVFAGGINMALNKPVTSQYVALFGGDIANVTNGQSDTQTDSQLFVPNNLGLNYVDIDLGQLYEIDSLKIWHFYNDGRIFFNSKTQVSADGVTWITVFDSAVSGEYPETAQGHTITLNPSADPSLLIDLPFQNNFENAVAGGLGFEIAGGAPTYGVGRKGNDVCAIFNGSQSIKTVAPLDLQGDKVSICYWVKTTSTSIGIVAELSADFNAANAFVTFINEAAPNSVLIGDYKNGINYGRSEIVVNNDVWHFVVCTIDRSLGNLQNTIYIDGIKNYLQLSGDLDLTGGWDIYPMYMGQRAGTSFGLIGSLQDFKVYNRVLSQQEITDLYNA